MKKSFYTDIVLAHHWLVTYRGGERVLAEFRALFPKSPILTLVHRAGDIPSEIEGGRVCTSWLSRLPGAGRFYKQLFPLHALAIKGLRTPAGTRLVLSSDAAMIKGLGLSQGTKQVCYCHSPPRYLWGMEEDYLGDASSVGKLGALVFRWFAPSARRFDYAAAQQVDHFIANSRFIAERIHRCYGRQSEVIYPPVSVEDFDHTKPAGDFYLLVSQLVPYKRVDIAVRAFTVLGKRLIVIGEGSEMEKLREIAGPTVQFLGRQPFGEVKRYFETCRAFLHPQIEDFGITAVEAQAAGRPVIAYRGGGALETVVEDKTGIFFDEQTPDALAAAIMRFESLPYEQFSGCRKQAESFNRMRFRREIESFLMCHYSDLLKNYKWPDHTINHV